LAHELAHTLQQGNTGSAVQRQATPVAEQAPPPADLGCETAADAPFEGVVAASFAVNSADLSEEDADWLAQVALGWWQNEAYADIRIDGYASAEGTTDHNWYLSCDRARAVERELLYPNMHDYDGIPPAYVNSVFAHGETDEFSEGLAANRVVIITISGLPVSDVPLPAEEGPTPCPPLDALFGGRTAAYPLRLAWDAIGCFCGAMAIMDLGPTFAPVEVADCLCNIITAIQDGGTRVYNAFYSLCEAVTWAARGFEGTPPWSVIIDRIGDSAAFITLVGLVGFDCITIVLELLGATGTGAGTGLGTAPSGPLALLAAAVGAVSASTVLSLALDGSAMVMQNIITQGTPFPSGQCASCLRVLEWGLTQVVPKLDEFRRWAIEWGIETYYPELIVELGADIEPWIDDLVATARISWIDEDWWCGKPPGRIQPDAAAVWSWILESDSEEKMRDVTRILLEALPFVMPAESP
jgi:hypothetical protein